MPTAGDHSALDSVDRRNGKGAKLPTIPDDINGVTMEFAKTVNKQVTDEMLEAMKATISSDAVSGEKIKKLWVSSAKDSHKCPSRHVTGNGVDISRVNGKFIVSSYDSDSSIKKIVDGLQNKFEDAPKRRENFGPTIKKKNGKDHSVSGHKDHFHWSVNGDHSECSKGLKNLLENLRRRLFGQQTNTSSEEVCGI